MYAFGIFYLDMSFALRTADFYNDSFSDTVGDDPLYLNVLLITMIIISDLLVPETVGGAQKYELN